MANQTKLAVILHADVIGSTDLVQRDELLAHKRMHEVFARLSEAIKHYKCINTVNCRKMLDEARWKVHCIRNGLDPAEHLLQLINAVSAEVKKMHSTVE